MRIIVLGGDGCLGWPTALHLSSVGHEVAVVANFARRRYDQELGVESLVPMESLRVRAGARRDKRGRDIQCSVGDLTDAAFTYRPLERFHPDAVVHSAEQRSAPCSMIDRQHAVYTHQNNVEIEHKGRKDRVLFPKRPRSFYHLTKVHDSRHIDFGCRIWGLRATDLSQGVVYGQQTLETEGDDRLATRSDYDSALGTVLNRFCIQAVLGHPLTVNGNGGAFNQIAEWMSVLDIARTIADCSSVPVTIEHPDNPRVEADEHYYSVKHTGLIELDWKPNRLSDTLIQSLLKIATRYAHRARLDAMRPTVNWRGARRGGN